MEPGQRCETCNHWDAWIDDSINTGDCRLAASFGEDFGEDKLMLAWDIGSYSAGLRTRKDFCCVLWMRKPTKSEIAAEEEKLLAALNAPREKTNAN